MVVNPRHHGTEVASRREKRRALDNVPSRGVRACEALDEGVNLSIAGRVL
jgi:hypothetical protein